MVVANKEGPNLTYCNHHIQLLVSIILITGGKHRYKNWS